ncbi:MAG TPA: cupin domain-containing protein [Streptosporangiaceae bacterium]|nr:cupin domain-containing protein [Streptosporangiaceae bacterium]
MPVIHPAEIAVHQVHGSTFSSFVAPSRGSTQLCAWQLRVPAGLTGAAHRPTREEVLLVLDGDLTITLDGTATDLVAGDVLFVPADSELRVDGGTSDATAWVTTTPGLEAVMADGSRIAPPWAN